MNADVTERRDDERWRPPKSQRRWQEIYKCGCISGLVQRKSELTGYCSTHGDSRREVFHD